ncbi:hypothetical protein N7526_011344 [Penicillium atrosanguineum]|nr:hypothetical protein N7526_011344 [Penicillium atrosanguineum]
MDPQFSEMFYPVDVSSYPPDYSRLPFYNDSVLFDSDYKPSNFTSMPATPPSVSASHFRPSNSYWLCGFGPFYRQRTFIRNRISILGPPGLPRSVG